MAGLNRHTGKSLTGWDEVVQSIDVIFSTEMASRTMRRWFGSVGPSLLGRLLTPKLFLLFMTVLAVAIDLWEPRFKVTRIIPGRNSSEGLRLGDLALVIEGDYRPRAHLGDFRSEGLRRLGVAGSESGLSFSQA